MKKTTDTPADDEFAAACARAWNVLIPTRSRYLAAVSTHYDEVLHEVAERAERVGSVGKMDIAALLVWKRLSAQTRWVSVFMSLPDTHVRAVTERAVAAVRDTALPRSEAARLGRAILADSKMPGFRKGDALASAVLTAAAPTRMAVYDERVQRSLDALGLPLTREPGRYGRYMQLLDDLLAHGGAHAGGWTARDLDTALYWANGQPHEPAES
ncbi:hypothetical protein [Streptomyces cupreus]|uniref:Uncharacterized protein n=1 Tax=Streptomyces cupreus TaxID=2759956 RepID=A0A7X1MB20_9ACTN|nr:hypothetical protein [Streptomyces cupreus]MBC2904313.1 hypothetical protein [Streptomyces cupreus]